MSCKWEDFLARHPMPDLHAQKPREAAQAFLRPSEGLDKGRGAKPSEEPAQGRCEVGEHYLPLGSQAVPGQDGVFHVWVSTRPDAGHPY